ncbi:MAG TPA: flagellar basal body P-ring formation chaperone FlgA [Dongiaceae bacterium]|jgi:flagella basal body P-ring formation protein FlgA|nr:flagellar basal body P-ring formation chaperone FlgA [Dongiaceae bacterium]
MRSFFPFLLLLLCISPGWADTITLREGIRVNGPDIHLGDLFSGPLGELSELAVARSPAPGQSTALSGRTIATIARTYGLDWRPDFRPQQVTVARNGRELTPDKFTAALIAAIHAQPGAPQNFLLDWKNANFDVWLPVDQVADILVSHLVIGAQGSRVSADILVPAVAPYEVRAHVEAGLTPLQNVPVLKRGVARGEKITADILDGTDWPSARLPANVVTDPALALDQVATHDLREGHFLMPSDVTPETLVHRGDFVMVHYSKGGLELTLRGKALEDGMARHVIHLVNIASNRPMAGTVVAAGLVEITNAQ